MKAIVLCETPEERGMGQYEQELIFVLADFIRRLRRESGIEPKAVNLTTNIIAYSATSLLYSDYINTIRDSTLRKRAPKQLVNETSVNCKIFATTQFSKRVIQLHAGKRPRIAKVETSAYYEIQNQ